MCKINHSGKENDIPSNDSIFNWIINTIAFDDGRHVGITLHKDAAEKVGANGRMYMQTPDNAKQNPIVCMAPHDLIGIASRMRPFVGQLGTTPSGAFPDSHNAGDFGSALLNAPHEFAKTAETLKNKTDGHMDVNTVRAGAIVIAPVKVKGAGVYVGDVHAMQGPGEIAGHTTDVCASVTLRVSVLKNMNIDGPIILPNLEDVPYLAKPLTVEEKQILNNEAAKWGLDAYEEDSAPIAIIGTGATMNDAISNGLERGAQLFDMSIPEVMNRVTITGSVDIGRAPGVVTVSFRVPRAKLEKKQLWSLVNEQYHIV